MKQMIRKAWDRFEWELFKFVTEFTDDELQAMTERRFTFERRVYEIFMLFYMFGAILYSAARIYEDISVRAIGVIPPNFIQYSPIVLLVVTTCFMGYAGMSSERFKNVDPRQGP